MAGWIGVDLDGTLAGPGGSDGSDIGAPIPSMVTLVKNFLGRGIPVRIFTARAHCGDREVKKVKAWCRKAFGRELPVTNVKTPETLLMIDDRAVGIAANTGRLRSEEETNAMLRWALESSEK